MRKIRILLVQLTNTNLGDTVISDNAKYLLKKVMPFFGKKNYTVLPYAFRLEDLAQIRYADAVIFAGGGLVKFRQEELYGRIADIINEAEKWQVPVFMNSVGVESYDAEDERCQILKAALNQSCVKGISVRDDTDTLQKFYITNKNIRISSVFDPAVWSRETYADHMGRKTDVIGLGVAREGLFSDYGNAQIDKQFLLDYWAGVIRELEKCGRKWQVFTNGCTPDEVFARELMAYVGHGDKAEAPRFTEQLIRYINSYKSIIACRMHSNIIAYTFKVPSIGLIWNNKLRLWGEKIGYKDRFLEPGELDPALTVQRLFKAEEEGCKGPDRSQKMACYNELKWFVRKYCVQRENACGEEKMDFQKHMAATALGSVDYMYRNMNSFDTFKAMYEAGYRNFEIDLRLTKDLKIACCNGWTDKTYAALGRPYPETAEDKAMTMDEFNACRYYGIYAPESFECFADNLARLDLTREEKDKLTIILDIGKPKKEHLESMFAQIAETVGKTTLNKKCFIIRLQRKNDVKLWKAGKTGIRIAYYMPDVPDESLRAEKQQEVIDFCRKEGIKTVSMNAAVYTDEMAELMNSSGLKVLMLSCTKAGDVIHAIENGAAYVGSFYHTPEYMAALTQR